MIIGIVTEAYYARFFLCYPSLDICIYLVERIELIF